jgi:hypothetical protein
MSKDDVGYYYYDNPSIAELVPSRGPDQGHTEILIKGNNFFPYRDMLTEINNGNDTFA